MFASRLELRFLCVAYAAHFLFILEGKMGTFLVVTSGFGIFLSIGVFAISFILKIIFLIAKKTEK